MMSGPRQRGSTGPLKALELAEAGYANHVEPRITDSSRPTSNTFVKRRKSSRASAGVMTIARAKLRRFLLMLQRNPHLLSQVLACTIGIAIILGIILAVSLRYTSSETTDSHERVSVAHRIKNYAATTLNKLPAHPKRNNEGVARDTQHHVNDRKGKVNDRRVQQPAFDILISSIHPAIATFNHPGNSQFSEEVGWYPDYGGLQIVFFEDQDARRFITQDLSAYKNDFRDPDVAPDDDVDAYYFFDDDYLRGLDNIFPDEETTKHTQCRKIAEHTLNLQNCNEFHQLDALSPTSRFTYLNAGAYRQVFAMMHLHGNEMERIALKDISVEHEIQHDNFEFVRMDAIVAERLSASPRIYDIYGFCGIGILSEYFYHGDIEVDVTGGDEGYMDSEKQQDDTVLKPQNNLTGIQKLVLALEMSEALADLHGYPNGMIVHDDVQLSQYLFNKDKTRLKLNDFNRAEFRLFDETTNEYCHWKNGPGQGNWRSPEEYVDQTLTEQIDVWSLGNNMYTVLTGLNPLYDVRHNSIFTKKILNGETAFIDPRYHDRSPSEAVLAELIPKCYAFKPEDRPTIFEIVDVLKNAVSKNLGPGMTRAKVLQSINTEI